MKNKILIRILSIFFAAVFLLAIVPTSASAASVETTPVLDDLKKMEDFVLEDYVKNVYDDTLSIITLDEYGYDYRGYANDYGLYIYIFNPSGVPIKNSNNNTIELGTKIGSDGYPTYSTYNLLPCSYSIETGYEYLFYKFKIDVDGEFYSKLNQKRKYYIGDISVVRDDIGYSVIRQEASCMFLYTGYSAYHGVDPYSDKSDLRCDVDMSETVKLDLQAASWKTISSDKGKNYQYEVSSVYFAVPNYWLEKYGSDTDLYKGLYSLYCSWYEVHTNFLLTDNNELYSLAQAIEDKYLIKTDAPNKNYGFRFVTDLGRLDWFERCFNISYGGYPDSYPSALYVPVLNKALYGDLEDFDSSNIFYEAIKDDNNYYSFGIGYDGRKYGYNEKLFTVEDGDLNSLIASYASAHNDFVTWLKGLTHLEEDVGGYAPIEVFHKVTSSDFSYSSTFEGAEALFVSEKDYIDLKNYYNSLDPELYTVFIMRFAVTDYYCSSISVSDWSLETEDSFPGNNYYIEKTLFLQFDVLEMSFKDEYGNIKTLPVQADPLDIVGIITPPPSDDDNDDGGGSGFDIVALIIGIFVLLALTLLIIWVVFKIKNIYLSKEKSINSNSKKRTKNIRKGKRK